MEYVILLIVIVIIVIFIVYIVQKSEDIHDLDKDVDDQNTKILELQKKLKEKSENFNEKILEIDKLNNEIAQLKKELSNYTQIEKDSLSLNVEDNESEQELKEEKSDNNSIEENKKSSLELSDLNPEKQEIFDIMENTNSNLFITGKAGTGKSYLLKFFRRHTSKKVLYCAPTGIAALNIDGVTLHSAFGWNNLMDDNEIALSTNQISLLKSIDTLVIDEISMVRVDVFNQIDKILRKANNCNTIFGGKQIILFGDLFQLPPVAKREEAEFFTDRYGGIFFFNSPAYKSGNFKFRELKEIFRQTDKEFIDILNNIRIGNICEEHIQSLNKHYVTEVPRRVVQVVPMKNEANIINMENLEKLQSKQYEYPAKVLIGENNIKPTDFPCEFNLKLKVGALVMMITNDQEHKRWVNGTLGIVSGLSPTMVKVTINGTAFEISPVSFDKKKCEYDREEGKLRYITEASVSQFPLILAYAITIHKSQGMTYQQIACNLDSCFAPGQAYVALSRCANYDKLYLTKKIDAGSIITDKTVTSFYNKIKDSE